LRTQTNRTKHPLCSTLTSPTSFLHGGSNFPVYGGAYPTPHDIALGNALDEIYVLTLPAFTWFKANYTPSTSRQSHTCHVVGNRQLLAIGGADPVVQEYYALAAKNSTDPWKQGLGVFDMTEMKWKEGFDARAEAYRSPDVVRQWYRDKYVCTVELLLYGMPELINQLVHAILKNGLHRTLENCSETGEPRSVPQIPILPAHQAPRVQKAIPIRQIQKRHHQYTLQT
jgi:hypothetical protein